MAASGILWRDMLDTAEQACDASSHGQGSSIFGRCVDTRLKSNFGRQEGTAKVSAAQDRKDITIVWTAWLVDSMAVWQRLDEQKYLISGPTSEKPILDDRDHLVDEDHLSEESEVDVAVDIEDADIDWGTADAELDAYLEQSGAYHSLMSYSIL